MPSFPSLLAGAALALAGVASTASAYTANSENRVLLQIQDQSDYQTVANIVGDIFKDEPFLAWARPVDIPKLEDLGVGYDVVDVDWDAALQQMIAQGGAPGPDGSIKAFASTEAIERASQQAAGYDDDAWFMLYHRYPDFIKKIKGYTFHAAPELDAVWVDSIGQTYEGRDIGVAQFGGRKTNYKKWFHIQAQIHAREWVAGHATLFAIRELLRNYEDGEERAKFVLDNVRINYIPLTNPDGYEYTWTIDRYWRKNRRINEDIAGTDITVVTPAIRIVCPAGSTGVDMNRNYDDHFGGGGTSTDPCADTYRGPFAESEPVVKHSVRQMMELKADGADFLGGFDVHTASALILRPVGWGFIPENVCPDNQAYINRIGALTKQAILDKNGYAYKNVPSSGLYIAAGVAGDWFYSNLTEFRNGLGFELRPTRDGDPYGTLFLAWSPPPTEIIPTGEEFYEGMMVSLEDAAQAAAGLVPRIVNDQIYDIYYGDEPEYTGDEDNPIFRCSEPRRSTANAASSALKGSDGSGSTVSTGVIAGMAGAAAGLAAVAGLGVVYSRRKAAHAAAVEQLARNLDNVSVDQAQA